MNSSICTGMQDISSSSMLGTFAKRAVIYDMLRQALTRLCWLCTFTAVDAINRLTPSMNRPKNILLNLGFPAHSFYIFADDAFILLCLTGNAKRLTEAALKKGSCS